MAREWSVKNLYFYLVCLVTLMLVIIGFIGAFTNAMQLLLPSEPNITLMSVYYPEHRGDSGVVFNPPSLEELEARRQEQEQWHYHTLSYTRRSLLNSIALFLIPIPFYIFHWRRVRPAPARRV